MFVKGATANSSDEPPTVGSRKVMDEQNCSYSEDSKMERLNHMWWASVNQVALIYVIIEVAIYS